MAETGNGRENPKMNKPLNLFFYIILVAKTSKLQTSKKYLTCSFSHKEIKDFPRLF